MTASSSASPGVRLSCSALRSRSRSSCARWRRAASGRVGQVADRRLATPGRRPCRAPCPGRPPAGTRCRSCAAPPLPADGRDRDEAGQVLVLGAQAVEHPRAHRRPDEVRRAGVQEQRRRAVGDALGVQRVEEAEVVDVPVDLGEQVRRPAAASGRAARTSRAASSPAASSRACPVLASSAGVVERHHLAVVLVEPRLVVERIDVADAALHEQEDDALRPPPAGAASSARAGSRARRRSPGRSAPRGRGSRTRSRRSSGCRVA